MSDLTLLLVDWAAKSALLILLASLATQLMPGRAGLRRLIWIVTLAGVLALPLATLGEPAAAVIRVSRPTGPLPTATVARWPEILWLVGAASVIGAIGSGYVGLLLAMRRSEPWFEEIDAVPGTGFGRRGVVRLAGDDSLKSPIAFGLVRPVVLLPRSAGCWKRERLRAVLIHELEHIRQLDVAAQILSQLAVAMLWFNPFVWYAAAALRRECEANADEAVIRAGIRPSDYAAMLLEFALAANRSLGPKVALSIVRSPNIEGRILAILRPMPILARASGVAGLIATILGLCIVSASGEVRVAAFFSPTSPRFSSEWLQGFEMGRNYKAAHPNEDIRGPSGLNAEERRAIEYALRNRPPP